MEKRKTSRFLSLVLVFLFMLCVVCPVSIGQSGDDVCTILVEDGVLSILRDGKEAETYTLDGQHKAVFRIQGDRVTVSFVEDNEAPFRQSFEFVDCDVVWDDAAKTAYAKDPLRISSYVDREQKIDAALWQLSAEARACFWQSFNLATLRFDQALEAMEPGEKLAVIADIDDTLVDGVMYTADVLQDGEWTNAAFKESLASDACLPLPGAVEFMNYVVDKGGSVFYITNRDPSLREVTYVRMAEMGFPMVDEDHVFIRETGMASSKESRRAAVEKDYEVVLVLGDNLEDFADLFPVKEGVDARRDAVDSIRDEWGRKFIMFPNAVYGDWEKAIYCYDKTKTPQQRMLDKIAVLDQYKYTR